MRRLIICIALACVAFSVQAQQDSLNIHSLYHWKDTTLVPSSAHFNTYNEIWGVIVNGREYAIIGSSAGTHFFDVTDPQNSVQVDFVAGANQGASVVHRDYHDYAGYLYMVCDEGASTLQIADLSYLPDSVHLVYDSDVLMKTSHNIFIDSATARMYACGGQGMGNMLDVYSLQNPAQPELLIRCHQDVSWWNGTIGYCHDIFARNDTLYCNAGFPGFFVVDMSNPLQPELIASLTQYPQSGYNHSGWLSCDGNTYVLADETHGMDLKLLDVSDLSNITVLDTIDPGNDSLALPHNPIIHGDYAYVAYYFDGLYVWDISDPSSAFVAGFYDTSTRTHQNGKYEGNWGVYPFLPSGTILVSDMQEGLFVLDASSAVGAPAPVCQSSWTSAIEDSPLGANPISKSTSWSLIDLQGRLVASGTGQAPAFASGIGGSVAPGLYVLQEHTTQGVSARKIHIGAQ